jgi:hypothetical protein
MRTIVTLLVLACSFLFLDAKQIGGDSEVASTNESGKVAQDRGRANFSYKNFLTTEEEVNAIFEKILEETREEKTKGELSPSYWEIASAKFSIYSQYPYIALDTKYSQTWYEKVQKVLTLLPEIKKNVDVSKINRDLELFNSSKQHYIKGITILHDLLSKPEKADPNVLKRLKERREIEEKREREKERATKKKS